MNTENATPKAHGAESLSTDGLEPIAPPARIWMQPDPDDESVTEVGEFTTWCQDSVGVNDIEYVLAGSGPDMAEELRSVMRWEGKRMGAVSMGVLKGVIARLEGSNG